MAIVVFEGFDDLDALGPYEVLRDAQWALDANRAPKRLLVRLVTREPAERVVSAHALEVVPQGTLDDNVDLVLVPGGGWGNKELAGAWGEIQRGFLPSALAAAHRQGVRMAGVCTGTMLLSAAEITRGRRATTHHAALQALQEEGANVIAERVVDDGDVVSCGGVTSGIDLALWLVEREFGRPLADDIASAIEYERYRPGPQ